MPPQELFIDTGSTRDWEESRALMDDLEIPDVRKERMGMGWGEGESYSICTFRSARSLPLLGLYVLLKNNVMCKWC